MEPPPLPVKGWKAVLVFGGTGVEGDDGEEEEGKKEGEAKAAERLFWRGRVILSYTGAAARLLSLTCK